MTSSCARCCTCALSAHPMPTPKSSVSILRPARLFPGSSARLPALRSCRRPSLLSKSVPILSPRSKITRWQCQKSATRVSRWAVIAESPAIADDAAELVQVEYEALDPVVDAEEALKDNSILHEEAGTNRVWTGVFEYGDVDKAFEDAAYVVNIDRLHFHRFSSTPLENNVIIAQWDAKDERIYYWCNNSFPSFAIQFLAAHLSVHIDRIRVQTFDIGGSFGIKITSYPQMA